MKNKSFNFLEVLKAAKSSSFIIDSSFFTWDWIFENEKNYLKVLEGNYKTKENEDKRQNIKTNILS